MTGLSLAALLLSGMPIALALIGTTLVYIFLSGNIGLLGSLPQIMFGAAEIYDLLAIPLFILLGEIMNEGGMTRRIVAATKAWISRLPNSLAYVCLTANLVLAAIMGSATAQIAVMSRIMVPEMERDGYERSYAAALTSAAGLLGPIIPPSMPFIIFGVVAQVPIADLFRGGILPGLLLFALFAGSIAFFARRDPERAVVVRQTTVEKMRLLVDALATLVIPVLIVGGIAAGIVTPTESAGIAVAFAALIGVVVYRELTLAKIPEILDRTAANTALVMFLIISAKMFGWVLTFNQVPQATAAFIQSVTSDPTVFMFLIFGALLLVGTILDGIAAIIILAPILLPIATSHYGIDPIQFGVMMCMTLVLGLLTPPVGAGLYIASGTTGIPILALSHRVLPYLLMAAAVIVAVILLPAMVRPF